MKEKILELINKKREDYWDFKECWYENKANLIHDILCMANSQNDEDSLIIIGVTNDYKIKGIKDNENRLNQQKIIDLLKGQKFFGNNRPKIEVHNLKYGKKEIDVIVILNTFMTPYFLLEDKHKDNVRVRKFAIYTRNGDTNTPIDNYADTNEVEFLWRKRFLLTNDIITRFTNEINSFERWEAKFLNKDEFIFINKFSPEFSISYKTNCFGYIHEDLVASLLNFEHLYHGLCELKYFGNPISNFEFLGLNSILVPVPKNYYKNNSNCLLYIKDTLEFIIYDFIKKSTFDNYHKNDYIKFDETVTIFEDEKEFNNFNDYIKNNLKDYNDIVNNTKKNFKYSKENLDNLKSLKYENISCTEYNKKALVRYAHFVANKKMYVKFKKTINKKCK